ncbi:MAG: hypothetical protein A2086_03285 [Spirochaetes bacterium GWD1_27_9]|nr:MAG: hypothetical protein A2Z98_12520 [Spirochaetes bacterium GWB1_27_13]OHD45274.1 MAG: hypothetical protein A2086_03285 [Spirochaetes bacterium GWD1_27_9]
MYEINDLIRDCGLSPIEYENLLWYMHSPRGMGKNTIIERLKNFKFVKDTFDNAQIDSNKKDFYLQKFKNMILFPAEDTILNLKTIITSCRKKK